MRTLTFTVQIQADYPKASRNILTSYDGVTGGAQIIPAPRNVKITTLPDD